MIDPTKDGLYISRKRKLEATQVSTSQGTNNIPSPPSSGWTIDLKYLPEFNDINIQEHLKRSGKSSDGKQAKYITRPDKRGYHFFTGKYLHSYQIQKYQNHIYIKAECYRSYQKSKDPHKVSCVLSESFPHNVVNASCSCVAGLSGSCNHVFALLHQTGDYSKAATKCVPTEVSKTSTIQQWDKPRWQGVNAESIMSTTVQKARMEKGGKPVTCTLYEARVPAAIPNNSQTIKDVKEALSAENELYGFAYMATPDDEDTKYVQTTLGHKAPVGSVLSYQLALTEGHFGVNYRSDSVNSMKCSDGCETNLLTDFPSFPLTGQPNTINNDFNNATDTMSFMSQHKLVIDLAEAHAIEIETRGQSQSDKWFNQRRYRLTASKFHRICQRKKASCDVLVKEIIFQKKYDNHHKIPIQMRLGLKYEAIAIDKYLEYMKNVGHEVAVHPSDLVVPHETPYLACSPDGKVTDPQSHPHFGLVEVKYSHTYQGIEPKDAADIGATDFCLENVDGTVRLKNSHMYYTQIQGQMALCKATWCDFVVYTPKGMHIERVSFNEEFWKNVNDKLEKFYISMFVPTVRKLSSTNENNLPKDDN